MNPIASNVNITIIHVLFGKIPKWFPFFLQSCEYNSRIQFIIFTDNNELSFNAENVRIVRITKRDLSLLITKAIGIKARFKDSYKICDFRPAYGEIFKDYLHSADYWGYCDNDIILGNIANLLLDFLPQNFDIISAYENFLSGPFCLYKNEEKICNLFKNAYGYKKTLSSFRHLAFDENITRSAYEGIDKKKIQLFIKYLWSIFVDKKKIGQTFKQLKFDFKWYYKRKRLTNSYPIDMTEVIWKNSSVLKVYYKQLLNSDRHYERQKLKNWKLKWEKGHLIDLTTQKEIFAFHFVESKLRSSFEIKSYEKNTNFIITPEGIY